MMRYLSQNRRIRFTRKNVAAFVNLKRISTNDLCVEPDRDVSRELRFAGSGRSDNEKHVGHSVDSKRFLQPRARNPRIGALVVGQLEDYFECQLATGLTSRWLSKPFAR
jgi:hypothetical protein